MILYIFEGESDAHHTLQLIIGSVLDLRAKLVSQVMTPIDDVFTMSIDDVMDRNTVDRVRRETGDEFWHGNSNFFK